MTAIKLISFQKLIRGIKVLLLALAFILGACAEEETSVAPDNRLYYGDELEVAIKGAALQVVGEDLSFYDPYHEGVRYELIVYTEGLNATFDDFGKVVKNSGEGYFLELSFNSASAPEPESRNYYANIPYVGTYPLGSIWSFYLQHYHPEDGFYEGAFRNGSVSLRKNGAHWIIEGQDLVSAHQGIGASFYYEGPMEIYDQRKNQ